MKRLAGFILLLSITFLWAEHSALAQAPKDLDGKIAFLSKGSVWVGDPGGAGRVRITPPDQQVEEFVFSPGLNYLAYTKIIAYVDEPGLWEEDEVVPQRALCAIVIMEPATGKVLKVIDPPDGNWIYPAQWTSPTQLLYYVASGFDVWGYFVYDERTGSAAEIDVEKGGRLMDADVAGSFLLYTSDTGLGATYTENLHFVDQKTKEDRIILSRRSIENPK
ncbi:MAG: hypothetical protein PHY31_05615, partial [Smithellaceae bacterium]|nr:hypothetical protein [Smithellaceae bacterium]